MNGLRDAAASKGSPPASQSPSAIALSDTNTASSASSATRGSHCPGAFGIGRIVSRWRPTSRVNAPPMLPLVLAAAAVVKGNGQRSGLLCHHIEGVAPAGDCSFNHYQRPAQGVFEPFPAAFLDGDGDQTPLVFQCQEHRSGQGTLAPYHPAGRPHQIAFAAVLHRVAVQHVRPQQRAGQFHHLPIGTQAPAKRTRPASARL